MAAVIGLIGAPTDIGAGMRGASMGPEALRVAGSSPSLEAQGLEVRDQGNLNGPGNPNSPSHEGYRHLAEVVAWNQLVHAAVHAELQAARLPVLLGGDHSLARGIDQRGRAPLPRAAQAAADPVARRARGFQHQRPDAERQPARHAGGLPVRTRSARADRDRRGGAGDQAEHDPADRHPQRRPGREAPGA